MDISIGPTQGYPAARADLPVATGGARPQGDAPGSGSSSVAASAPASRPSGSELADAVQSGNKALQVHSNALEFQVDDKSHQSLVKVVDTQTQQVIRQIPSEEFLRIAQGIDDYQAHLIHEKA